MTMEVVKVQRPISTNDPNIHWLFYGEGRTNTAMIPEAAIPAEIKAAMGKRKKAFFWGRLEPSKTQPGTFNWMLGDEAPEQEW